MTERREEKMRRVSLGVRTGVAISALALALSPVLALSAGASGGGWTPVGQGNNPGSLPGATVFGTYPADTPETVSFVLDEQNKNQLEAQVENGISNYLSVSQFASQYGQSQSNIQALTSYLSKFGIKSTVYPDDVDISTTGTAGDYDAALSVQQDQYHVPSFPGHNGGWGIPAQNVHGATTAPELPSQLASVTTRRLSASLSTTSPLSPSLNTGTPTTVSPSWGYRTRVTCRRTSSRTMD
jgi:kumamolisin